MRTNLTIQLLHTTLSVDRVVRTHVQRSSGTTEFRDCWIGHRTRVAGPNDARPYDTAINAVLDVHTNYGAQETELNSAS